MILSARRPLSAILLAGEIGEWLVPSVVPLGYIEPIDDDRSVAEITFIEALDLRSRGGGVDLRAADRWPRWPNGQRQAEQQAASFDGEERHWLYGYCAARARRIVGEQAALIFALLPDIACRPLVTGDELEALIRDRR